MATVPLKYLHQYFTTTLNVGGGLDNSQTTGIIVQAVSGLDIAKPGVACLTYADPINTSTAEWITYTSIDGSNELQGVTRGTEGFGAKTHASNAVVAFPLSESHINNINAMFDTTGLDVKQIATPASPDSGRNKLYFKSDDYLYGLTSGGLEYNIGGASSLSRQAIINGNFDVWQRGASVATSTDGTIYFQADRWFDFKDDNGGTSPTLTRTRQALTDGDIANAYYYSRLATNGAGTSLGTASAHYYMQRIEHGTRLLCGLDKTVTVSFWAKSDIANKKLGIYLNQNYGSGGSPTSAETINGTKWTLTTTWTKYTHTFTTNTLVGKTFGTADDDYLQVTFMYMWGSTLGVTVGDTGNAETYVGSGNIDIAQVQLCAGSVALPFQPKSYEEEKLDCKPYYQKSYDDGTALGTDTYLGAVQTRSASTYRLYQGSVQFPVEMRAIPVVTLYSKTGASGKIRNIDDSNDITVSTTSLIGTKSYIIDLNNAATANKEYCWHWTASAEL